MTCSGGFRTWKPPGFAATIGAFRSTDEPSQAAVFNGGLPFIVWKPACRRLPWRSKMIKVPLTVVGAEQLKAELQTPEKRGASE